jgi:hypothetical protein
MAATITLTTAPTVLHRFARTVTLAPIRMPVHLTDTGDLITSWTACSSESAHGMDGDSVADFAAAVDSVADFMMVADLIVVGSLDAGSTADQDLEIGQASPTAAEALAALLEADFAAAAASTEAAAVSMAAEAVAFMEAEAVASTEVAAVSMAAVSMAAVVVGSMEVAADMGVATGN